MTVIVVTMDEICLLLYSGVVLCAHSLEQADFHFNPLYVT